MPPSQLKRLKASLREQGIGGPQKSKKQKKAQRNNADSRLQKAAALASIREASNPFDFKHLARPHKHDYTTLNPQDARKTLLGRPGVTKSQGEETRKKTLLPEMNRRNKVGGILDRRIGESDPNMSLEDRMMARFEREMQRKRSGDVFNLEEAEDDFELTHGGKALRFDEDYDAQSIEGSSDGEDGGFLRKKRRRDVDSETDGDDAPQEEEPERKKSKKEVMEEVIAKSKQHKYERQQQKDDDDDLREELDQDLPDILAALRGHTKKVDAPPLEPKKDIFVNPDRAALLAGKSREEADKEYDKKLREMLYDQRSKPKDRTKTEQEKAEEAAARLRELEEQRNRRMNGQVDPESDDEKHVSDEEDESFYQNDAAEFGLPKSIGEGTRPVGVDDEDDFIVDDLSSSEELEGSEASDGPDDYDDNENDMAFLKDILPETSALEKTGSDALTLGSYSTSSKLPYTFPIPRTHTEFLEILGSVSIEDTPIVIQRIRARYHAGLKEENKTLLSDFACILIDHIVYLANQQPAVPLTIIETIIRHIHSLSKTYSIAVATHFREQLKDFHSSNNMLPGALVVFTAIGSIYPTSDHFHQVVTPAATLIASWLGLSFPSSAADIATGAFLGALLAKYINLSKRYYPEVIRYTALCLKSEHIIPALVNAHTRNILDFANLWQGTPAFVEIFTPLISLLQAVNQTSAVTQLRVRVQQAKTSRRPQLLHYHRPRAIRTAIPKFEGDNFDPTKHYDPDRERTEAKRLKAEYKKEKKGAMRELRKDANFIAREKLRQKKEKDHAYEEKFRKLVKEIQNEEGREKNAYEREMRKRKRK